MIDWFRNVEIQCDLKLVERRWKTAKEYSDSLTREIVPRLLRMFLFTGPDAAEINWFTERLTKLDQEFPTMNNTEILRLMAGVVMLASFQRSSYEADAFALGLRVYNSPGRTTEPAQPEILAEAKKYLQSEADNQRPSNFNGISENPKNTLDAASRDLETATAGTDAATIRAKWADYNQSIANVIQGRHELLSRQIKRLAEESSLLWWILGEYSTVLDRKANELTEAEYALICGAEAADRTHILPPPISVGPLLTRALASCKSSRKKSFTVVDFLAVAERQWSKGLSKRPGVGTCPEVLPLITGIVKTVEFDDAAAAVRVLPNICPGLKTDHPMSPSDAATQFYYELMFLKALAPDEDA